MLNNFHQTLYEYNGADYNPRQIYFHIASRKWFDLGSLNYCLGG